MFRIFLIGYLFLIHIQERKNAKMFVIYTLKPSLCIWANNFYVQIYVKLANVAYHRSLCLFILQFLYNKSFLYHIIC